MKISNAQRVAQKKTKRNFLCTENVEKKGTRWEISTHLVNSPSLRNGKMSFARQGGQQLPTACQCGYRGGRRERADLCTCAGLRNHVTAPPKLLTYMDKNPSIREYLVLRNRAMWRPVRHWCVLGQITSFSTGITPTATLRTRFGETHRVVFDSPIAAFRIELVPFSSWDICKPGNTMVLLGEVIIPDLSECIVNGRRLKNIYIFEVSQENLLRASDGLVSLKSGREEDARCFNCGKQGTYVLHVSG